MKYPPVVERKVTTDEARELVRRGSDFAATSVTGGVFKQTYYTPDGRMIKAAPDIRHFIKKNKEGKAVESGQRDANLDKGWLLHPPSDAERKVSCRWCDGWHNNQMEVDACQEASQKVALQREALAKQELSNENLKKDQEIESLKKQLDELTKLVKEKLGG